MRVYFRQARRLSYIVILSACFELEVGKEAEAAASTPKSGTWVGIHGLAGSHNSGIGQDNLEFEYTVGSSSVPRAQAQAT